MLLLLLLNFLLLQLLLLILRELHQFPLQSFADLDLSEWRLGGSYLDALRVQTHVVVADHGLSEGARSSRPLASSGYRKIVAVSADSTFTTLQIVPLFLWGLQSIELLCATIVSTIQVE